MKDYEIRLGVCCAPDKFETVCRLGYDYAELSLAYLASLDEDGYRAAKAAIPDGFKVESCNGLLPGTIHLSDDKFCPQECRDYLNKAFDRATSMGVEVVVFGSGASRNIPQGADPVRAQAQLLEFGGILGEIAGHYGILAVVEPLNFAECNILNSVTEATRFAKAVNSPHLQVLADLYHVARVNEPFANLEAAGAMLRHCHIANPDGRNAPSPENAYDYKPFFDTLRSIHYRGRVSIEGGIPNFEPDLINALSYLRALAN